MENIQCGGSNNIMKRYGLLIYALCVSSNWWMFSRFIAIHDANHDDAANLGGRGGEDCLNVFKFIAILNVFKFHHIVNQATMMVLPTWEEGAEGMCKTGDQS